MKKTILYIILSLVAIPSVFAGEDSKKKDWGHLTGSIESTSNVYVEDVPNNFYPSLQPQLKDGNIFASNDYVKLNYYKDRLSAGMQLEGYFPSLVGYPVSESMLSLSNLYVSWRDKSYSVTAGSFYEQLGSGLLFRSWEDRMLGLNNAMLGSRATYNYEDIFAVRAFWGIPRLNSIASTMAYGYTPKVFALGLSDVNVAAADVSLSLSNLIGWDSMTLSVEASVMNKHEKMSEVFELAGCRKNNVGFSGRMNFDKDGFFVKGEYVNAGKQISNASFVEVLGRKAENGNAQLIEFGYNRRGLGVTVTGRRTMNMDQRIYAYTSSARGYTSPVNILSYRPAMCTQYTYMLTALNPYNCDKSDEIGGQIDAFYNFRRGTKIGGKRGMKMHANFSTYYGLGDNGKDIKNLLFRDFSFDVEKQWTKKFKSMLMYSAQNNNNREATAHIVVADLLYKWTPVISTRMELQYLATKSLEGDWMAGLLEFNLAPHWSVFGSEMWNHGSTKLHYYNAGLSYTYEQIRVSAGYGRYKAGFICSGGVCREIPAYTGANLSLTASF